MGSCASGEAVGKPTPDEVAAYVKDLTPAQFEKLRTTIEQRPKSDPILYYMPVAGRGEVSRLICAMSGINLQMNMECSDALKKEAGSPSSLPILVHGDNVKLTQSHAIVGYLLDISPKYYNLSPAQRAKDSQINAIFDDVMSDLAKQILFNPARKEDPSAMKTEANKVADKWLSLIEGIMPDDGFINGLSYPTAADFCMVVMVEGVTPFKACWKIGEVDVLAKCPKIAKIVNRTKEVPEVKAHLAASDTLNGDPFGLMA